MLMHAALDTLLSAKSSSNPTESICPQPSLVEPNETAPLPAPPPLLAPDRGFYCPLKQEDFN